MASDLTEQESSKQTVWLVNSEDSSECRLEAKHWIKGSPLLARATGQVISSEKTSKFTCHSKELQGTHEWTQHAQSQNMWSVMQGRKAYLFYLHTDQEREGRVNNRKYVWDLALAIWQCLKSSSGLSIGLMRPSETAVCTGEWPCLMRGHDCQAEWGRDQLSWRLQSTDKENCRLWQRW